MKAAKNSSTLVPLCTNVAFHIANKFVQVFSFTAITLQIQLHAYLCEVWASLNNGWERGVLSYSCCDDPQLPKGIYEHLQSMTFSRHGLVVLNTACLQHASEYTGMLQPLVMWYSWNVEMHRTQLWSVHPKTNFSVLELNPSCLTFKASASAKCLK